ncbi:MULTISPECIES: transporter substrate-binding domain-containing protein [Planococcus]|uniref:Amino acid ABC transporter substrate-binding protein n=1 Tax=Planococcus faecalis TaxID=1598147 RepID=A0ABN4XS20_9BACL|nr:MULTISPECIES: transporter substrate-binding domain-containing protein [Planococcus]AQU79865.1 amino acid ABC transporter substrate-binding protein [Planococcus faecalis]MDJ0330772.1 transporter substrate-binding domain-containing protein [Planococcus sp. S3-L1]OHX53477.1 amino acid ABC transporter substrate-binding protein [Planococcus faecalis]
MNTYFLKKKTFLTTGVLATLLLVGCSNEESSTTKETSAWDEIQDKGSLTVATSGTLLATSFRDSESDELTGFEVEVVRELGNRLELDIEFKELGFDEMLTSVNTGQIDLAANDIEITEDRAEEFIFSTPIKHSYGTAVVRKDDLSDISSLEDLPGKKAAGASTSIYMEIARDYGAEEVTYDNASNEVYLRDVSIGRTDVILNDYYLSTFGVAAFPELNITIHPDIKYAPSEVGLVMNKDNTELADHVDTALEEMLKDGTITEISKEFFGGADVSIKPDIEEN